MIFPCTFVASSPVGDLHAQGIAEITLPVFAIPEPTRFALALSQSDTPP